MPSPTRRETNQLRTWRDIASVVGEVGLLIWVGGMFYYFYELKGFFRLAASMLEGNP